MFARDVDTGPKPPGAKPGNGWRWARITIRPVHAAMAVGLFSWIGFVTGLVELPRRQQEAAASVEHSLLFLRQTYSLEAHLQQAIADARGFALSQDPAYRLSSSAAAAEALRDLADLSALAADDPVQNERIGRLAPLIGSRLNVTREAPALVRDPRDGFVLPSARGEAVRNLSARIEALLSGIKEGETAQLRLHQANSARLLSVTVIAAIMSGVLAGGSAILTLFLLGGRRRQRRHLAELRAANEALEARVQERTAALATSESRQRGYFEHSPAALIDVEVTKDGRYLHQALNPAAEAIFDLPHGSTIGRRVRDIHAAPQGSIIEAGLAETVAGRAKTQGLATRTIRGQTRVIDWTRVPLADGDGRISNILICIRDVTEQIELERQVVAQARRETETAQREASHFRHSADVMFIVAVDEDESSDGAPELTLVSSNAAFARLCGERLPAAGHRLGACLPEAIEAEAVVHLRTCLAQGHAISYAASYQLPTGIRAFEGSITPVRHPDSARIAHLVDSSRDVTERNLAEASLRHSHKMEALGQLSSGVAHDFNNMIEAVMAGLEMVLEDVSPGTGAHGYATSALTAAQRGASLTRQLLAYARDQVLWPQAIDIDGFLAEMRKLLVRVIRPELAGGIEISVRVALGTPPLFADPAQLQTALLNLVLNAVRATRVAPVGATNQGPGGSRITIDASSHPDAGGGWVVVSVIDNGAGMNEATLARATDPFFTTTGAGDVDGTGSGVAGAGLGLSMVKGFAEQSGGELRLFSEPGVGTRVELQLPSVAEIGMITAGARVPWISGRVLVVDDATETLVTASEFLAKAGLQVTRARSAAHALNLLADGGSFDAILTDFAMPGMNGIDLILESRKILPDLPAMVITGFCDVGSETTLPPDVLVLHKPFSKIKLIQALQRVMARQGGAS